MMANAIKSGNLAHHQARKSKAQKKGKQKGQAKTLCVNLGAKKFSELNGNEKDDLLRAIALELGMVLPED